MFPMQQLLVAVQLEGAYEWVRAKGYTRSRIDFMDEGARVAWQDAPKPRGRGPVVWSKILARNLKGGRLNGGARS
jgi:hypothetical protein